MTIGVRLLLAVLLLGAAFWAGWEWRDRSADLKIMHRDLIEARAGNDALAKALNKERAKAEMLADIGRQYEQDKLAAKAAADALVGDLRAGNLRLRHELGALYTARLSSTAAHTVELGAAAQRGAELAAAAVGVGAACDARDRAWRAVAEADRR